MNKQVDKNSKGLKHEFVATVKQHAPELWDSFRRGLAEDLLDAGASQEKATNLITKHWSTEDVSYSKAADVVRKANEENEREKKLGTNPKTGRKTTPPKKPRT